MRTTVLACFPLFARCLCPHFVHDPLFSPHPGGFIEEPLQIINVCLGKRLWSWVDVDECPDRFTFLGSGTNQHVLTARPLFLLHLLHPLRRVTNVSRCLIRQRSNGKKE